MKASDWDARFAGNDYFYGVAPNDFLAAHAGTIPAGPVLCLAEGEGRNAVHLATLGREVTAVDQSAAGLAKAGRLAAGRGVRLHLVQADLAHYALGELAWAGIVWIFLHLPPARRRDLLGRVVAGLAPGGVLVLEVYSPAQLARGTGGPREPDRLASLIDVQADLPGMEFLVAREIEREICEGVGHHGLSAVVQVLARKAGLRAGAPAGLIRP